MVRFGVVTGGRPGGPWRVGPPFLHDVMQRILLVLRVMAVLLLLVSARAATSQVIGVQVNDASADRAEVTVSNPFEFEVRVVNLRLDFPQADGTRVFVFSEPGLDETLPPQRSWTGPVRFANPQGFDLSAAAGTSAAGGVDLDALEPPARAAIASGNLQTIKAQLDIVRPRVAPVSRAARFHGDVLATMEVENARYFNRERIDGLVTDLENAMCEGAGRRITSASSQSSRETAYQEMGSLLREANLHINCIPSEAKLVAARMLIASNRPQDALVIRELGEDGQPSPEWRPIVIQANLAFARTTAELEATVFSSLKPALEALNEVRRLDPQNAQLAATAAALLPRIARWIETACEPMTRDLENARELLGMLRPAWDDSADVRRAAGRFASALVESGLQYCTRREYINSRNEFVRGERILDGIPEWEDRRDEINRCRALGSLAEGRELASHPTDPAAPGRGLAKLDEALQRFPLTQEEQDAFTAHVAQAYVNVARRHIEAFAFPAAVNTLETAESTSPTGRTDGIREAWLFLAETHWERAGLLMTRPNIEESQDALERSEQINPARRDELESALRRASLVNRFGLPAGAAALALLVLGALMWGRRKPRTSIDDDL